LVAPGGSICLNPALCKYRTYRIAIHLSHYSDRETELTISEKFDTVDIYVYKLHGRQGTMAADRDVKGDSAKYSNN